MTLRDLLRDAAPVTVQEQSATQTLVNWDKISSRVVEVKGKHLISGALLAFSLEGAVRIVETFAHLLEESGDDAGFDGPDPDVLLRASAPMFTNIWLLDSLGQLMASNEPEMVNADGDDLVFHRIVFPLAKGVQAKTVSRMLNAADWLCPASEGFWNWLAPVCEDRKSHNSTGKHSLITTMDDGAPVFATVELDGRKLIVEVNSARRAQRAIDQLGDWLGGRLNSPLTEIRTPAQVISDDTADNESAMSLEITPHEMERLVHDMLTREYAGTLDEPVPALGNKTPRALVRTKVGKRQVAE